MATMMMIRMKMEDGGEGEGRGGEERRQETGEE